MLDRPPASLVAGQLRAHYLEGTLTGLRPRGGSGRSLLGDPKPHGTPLIDQQRLDAYEGSQFSQSTAWTYLINARRPFGLPTVGIMWIMNRTCRWDCHWAPF